MYRQYFGITEFNQPAVLVFLFLPQLGTETFQRLLISVGGVDELRVPVDRILTWPRLISSLHTCDQYMAVDSIKNSSTQCSGQDTVAGLQGCRRAEQWLQWWQRSGQRPRGWLCRTTVRTEGPKGRETGLLHADSL